MKPPTSLTSVCIAAALATTVPFLSSAQNTWTGAGADLNWSTPGNWSQNAAPAGYDNLLFEDFSYAGFTNGVGLVNNIVDTSSSVSAMFYAAVSGGTNKHFYTTLIPAGSVLTVGGVGYGASSFLVGGPTSGSTSNYTTILGAGRLEVNDPMSNFQVQQVTRATLDLVGLDNFTANVANLWVGASVPPDGSGKSGVLLLARTNTISTAPNLNAPGILIGKSAANCFGDISLGQDSIFNTDGLVVGGARSSTGPLFSSASLPTSLNFLPGQTEPTFKLRGSGGEFSRVSTFSIGDIAGQEYDYLGAPGGSAQGSADFSGGIVNILADSIFVGRSAADTGSGGSFTYGFGNLVVERGTIDVNRLYIAYKQGTNASSALNGGSSPISPCAVTVRSNAVVTVNQDLTMAFRNNGTSGSQTPFGALVVNDSGLVNLGGNLTTPTNGSSILQLGGGTLNLTGNGNVTLTTLMGYGTVAGANTITVMSNLVAGGALTPGTLNLGGNLALGTSFPITFNLGSTNTTGSGINDHLNVTGSVSFSNNPVLLSFNGPLIPGSNYTLINYTGTQEGSLAFTNRTRSDLGLDQTIPGQINLVVTNWAPATLTWQGTTNTTNHVWNTSNTYWTNNSTGLADKFYHGDALIFDDTAISPAVFPDGLLFPSSITFNCSAKNLMITNRSGYSGVIAGNCAITKNGTGTLTFGTYSNAFTGPINVNNGIWRLFDPNFSTPPNMPTLGSINSPMYVNDGATLDFAGVGSTATGKPIIVTGNGFNGLGAITNGSTSGSINGFALTLAGDTRISAETSALGLKSLLASAPPFSGWLDLNGWTLTKLGNNRFSIQEVVATNSGSINIGAGYFAVANSIVDGPGALNLSNNTYLVFGVASTASTIGYVAKTMNVHNAGLVAPASGNVAAPAIINSIVNLLGNLSVTNTQPIVMNGPVSGPFAINKYGSSNLVFNAANSYTGPTLINAGGLVLGSAGSISSSPLIQMAPGTLLDVTAKPASFTLAPAQTLIMAGSIFGDLTAGSGSTLLGSSIINGSLTIAAGAEAALGTTNVTGTTLVSSNLTLSGAHLTWELAPSFEISDAFVVGGDLTLSGINTFDLNSIGGFDPSGTNTLITYSGTLNGGLANLALNSAARFQVEFVNPALTPGKIQVRLVTPSPLLTWKGGDLRGPRDWDVKVTTNWDNGGTLDFFWSSDLVRFDDSATTYEVTLVGTLGPGSISMENSANSFFFGGAGRLVSSALTNYNGSLTISNTGNNFFTGQGLVLNSGEVTFAQPTNATLSANLSGYGTFAKAGSSNLTLIGDSSAFSGAVNINGGTLRAGSSNVLGLGAVTVVPGATLDVNGQVLNAATSVQVAGTGADGWGAINNRGAGQTNALANVRLAGNTTFGALSNAWGIINGFQGYGYALNKTNTQDVWIMNGADTDLGGIDVQQGRLVFSGAGTTLGRTDTNVIVRPNATLAFATTNAMPLSGLPPDSTDVGSKPVVLLANAALESVGFSYNRTSTNRHSGSISITNNGIFRVGGNSRLELNGPISGVNGQLLLNNGGTLVLNGTNTYTSNTLVYAGTLELSNVAALPPNTTLALSNLNAVGNPALQLANGPVFPANNILRMSSANAATSVGGDGTWTGPIFMHGSTTFNFYGGGTLLDLAGQMITTNAGGTVAFHGSNTRVGGSLVFSGNVTIGQGDGLGAADGERFTTVRFDNTNNWAAVPVFDRGRIILGTNNALPPGVAFNQIGTLSAGVADRRVIFDLNGHTQSLTSLKEVFPQNGLNFIGNSSSEKDATLVYAGTGTNTWTIKMVDTLDNPAEKRKLGLTVTSGLLETLANNAYTGPTLVSGGKFLVGVVVLNQSTTLRGYLDVSPVLVNGTGAFGGNGVVAGNVTIGAGGTLVPGDSYAFLGSGGTTSTLLTRIGHLTLEGSELTLAAGSRAIFEVDPGAGTNDAVVGISHLNLGGTLVITNLGTQAFTLGTVLRLFEFATATPGSINIQPPAPAPGLAWDASQLAVDGTLRVTTLPPPPVLGGIHRLPDNNFSFTVTGIDGQLYSLRASTNVATPVADWMVLQSATQVGGSITFTDLTATNSPQRFYAISAP